MSTPIDSPIATAEERRANRARAMEEYANRVSMRVSSGSGAGGAESDPIATPLITAHEGEDRTDNVHGLDTQLDAVDAALAAKQPLDTELTALATLTSAANKILRFTGSGTAGLLDFLDEDSMVSNSDVAVPSQQSVKAYVDAQGGGGGTGDYILIRDEKSSGTGGGTFTSGAWQTRDLNTEHHDTGSHASVASNQITLAAGAYRCRAHAPAEAVGHHKARLQNITDGTTLLLGTNEWTDTYTNAPLSRSSVEGRFTIAASKVIELQHRCSSTRSTFGFGAANGFGVNEIFSGVELIRE